MLGDDLGRRFALWHDRAVLHFMVDRRDRDAYLSALRRSLAPDGQLVIATFGPEAPPTCSGLPVHRYAADQLAELLPDFELASSRYELHHTPGARSSSSSTRASSGPEPRPASRTPARPESRRSRRSRPRRAPHVRRREARLVALVADQDHPPVGTGQLGVAVHGRRVERHSSRFRGMKAASGITPSAARWKSDLMSTRIAPSRIASSASRGETRASSRRASDSSSSTVSTRSVNSQPV